MRGYEWLWRAASAALLSCLVMISIASCTFSGPDNNAGRGPAPPAAVEAQEKKNTTMDAFRELAPPTGLKFTPLFAEPVSDEDARFRRLEDAVQALRNDFDTVTPSIVRLVAIEGDINNLVGQLETLTGTEAPVE